MNLKIYLIILNLIFGPLLLYTYYKGLTSGITGSNLWGEMPNYLRPASGISMIVSAIGYFIFTYYFLAKVDINTVFFNRFNFWLIIILYAFVLIPSCFWIDYTIQYMNTGLTGQWLWIFICLILYTVGIASALLLLTIYNLSSHEGLLYYLSMIGCLIFTIHTLIFDGLLWTYFFNK